MAQPFSFILASGSPRRKRLLTQVGLDFEVIVSGADETPLPGETPGPHTRRLAESKARAVAAEHPERWVLGADTTVAIDERFLGKPLGEDEAFAMLSTIAGRWHTVVSSFAIVSESSGRSAVETVKTRVFVRSLTPSEIRWYIATGEPMDKAGAYAVQGIGACIVERIEGSYTNVVGLPLAETVRAFESLGLLQLMAGHP